MHVKIMALLLFAAPGLFAQYEPCADYACDSLVVDSIIKLNHPGPVIGYDAIPVESISVQENGRIVEVQFSYFDYDVEIPLAEDLPNFVVKLNAVKKLDFSYSRLEQIPDSIHLLGNLEYLDFSGPGTYVNSFPPAFFRLPNLKTLILRNLEFDSLPDGFAELTSLKHLELPVISPDLDISNFLYELKNLEYLSLYGYQHGFSPRIGELVKLRVVKLDMLSCCPLPDAFYNLPILEELYLGVAVAPLPLRIFDIETLKVLNIGSNSLTAIPEQIGQLNNLEVLDVSGNSLIGLPPQIGQLGNLAVLNLRGNSLTGLPQQIGQLTNLRVFIADRNRELVELPDEISQLQNLEELNLSYNALTELPIPLFDLVNLRVLDVTENRLTGFPEQIGQLTNLQVLLGDLNQLTALPDGFSQLRNLERLSLTFNQLDSLPEGITGLNNIGKNGSDPRSTMSALRLFNNRLCDLPPEQEEWMNSHYTPDFQDYWKESQDCGTPVRTIDSRINENPATKLFHINGKKIKTGKKVRVPTVDENGRKYLNGQL